MSPTKMMTLAIGLGLCGMFLYLLLPVIMKNVDVLKWLQLEWWSLDVVDVELIRRKRNEKNYSANCSYHNCHFRNKFNFYWDWNTNDSFGDSSNAVGDYTISCLHTEQGFQLNNLIFLNYSIIRFEMKAVIIIANVYWCMFLWVNDG